MSMYRQLWLAVTLSTLLALLGGLMASTVSAQNYLSEQMTAKNADNALALALALSQQQPDTTMVELTVASLFDSGHYKLIRATDPAGKLIIERAAGPEKTAVPQWFINLVAIEGTPGQAQISNGWKPMGSVTLVSSSSFAYQSLWDGTMQLVAALAFSGLVSGYLGTLILRRLKRPLQQVVNQAQAIGQRNFITIEEPSVPELKQLAAAMNSMVAIFSGMFAEQADQLELIRRKANYDGLTGLANQTFFVVQLIESLDNEDKVNSTLLLIRITDLRDAQDGSRSAASDALIQAAAKVLIACASPVEGLCARFNGADFALLLPRNVPPRTTAEYLLAAMEVACQQGRLERPAVAIGMTRLRSGQDLPELLAEASAALEEAEASGISTVREAASLAGPESDSRQWLDSFERAISQKLVRLSGLPVTALDGKLIHSETQLEIKLEASGDWQQVRRWQPLIQELELAERVDMLAIGMALTALDADPSLAGLSVSIQPASMGSATFRSSLLLLLHGPSTSATRLALEMREDEAARQLTVFKAFSVELKQAGCRVGLQHVGVRQEDVALLRNLGLDYLKVDASFIRGVHYNPGNQAFLRGLTSIAHHIGTQVYAEGVVDPLELAELAALRLDGASGPAIKTSQPVNIQT